MQLIKEDKSKVLFDPRLDMLNVYNYKGNKLLLTLINQDGEKFVVDIDDFRPYFYVPKPFLDIVGVEISHIRLRDKTTNREFLFELYSGVSVNPRLERYTTVILGRGFWHSLTELFNDPDLQTKLNECIKQHGNKDLISVITRRLERKSVLVDPQYVFRVNEYKTTENGKIFFPYSDPLQRLFVHLVWNGLPTNKPFTIPESKFFRKYTNKEFLKDRITKLNFKKMFGTPALKTLNCLIQNCEKFREFLNKYVFDQLVSRLSYDNPSLEIVGVEVAGVLPINYIFKVKSKYFAPLAMMERVSTYTPAQVREWREIYPITYEADILYDFRYALDYYIETWQRAGVSPTTQPKKIFFFDIEVFRNFRLNTPNVNNPDHYVNSISVLISHKGETKSYLLFNTQGLSDEKKSELIENLRRNSVIGKGDKSKKHFFVVHPENPALKFEVFLYDDEQSLMNAFVSLLLKEDPHIITGWNILGFDIPFLLALMFERYPKLYEKFVKFNTSKQYVKNISANVLALYGLVGGASKQILEFIKTFLNKVSYKDDDGDFIHSLDVLITNFYIYVVRNILKTPALLKRYATPADNTATLTIRQLLDTELIYLADKVGWLFKDVDVSTKVGKSSLLYLLLKFLNLLFQLEHEITTHDGGSPTTLIKLINEIGEKIYSNEEWAMFLDAMKEKYLSKDEVENELVNIELPTAVFIDYYRLYKMEKQPKPESYSLDYVAQLEVGGSKEKYEGSLDDLYTTDPFKFVLYNIVDSWLVYKIDQKVGYLSLIDQLKSESSLPLKYFNANYRIKMGDGLIIRTLRERENPMVVVSRPNFQKEKYEGAFVFIPKVGMYQYVCDLDASSLYPSTNMTYLISHENFICKVGGLSLYELYIFHKLLRYIGNNKLDLKGVRGLLERPLAEVLKEINIEDPDAIDFLKEFKKVDLEGTPAVQWLNQTTCELITYVNFKKQSAGVSLRNVLNLFLVQVLPILGTNFSYTPNGAFWKRVPNWKENLSNAPIFPSMLYVAVNDRKKYKKIRDAFGIFGNLLKKISA